MYHYQKGDAAITIGEDVHYLRLTMGAMAEIAMQMEAPGPKELAVAMRDLKIGSARQILAALLRPCSPKLEVDQLTVNMSEINVQSCLPIIATLIQSNFEA